MSKVKFSLLKLNSELRSPTSLSESLQCIPKNLETISLSNKSRITALYIAEL